MERVTFPPPEKTKPNCDVHLVVSGGVTEQVPEEVEAGAPPDEDEVGGAVGEVSRGRQALGAAGTRAPRGGGVDGEELPVDHPPTAGVWKRKAHSLDVGRS